MAPLTSEQWDQLMRDVEWQAVRAQGPGGQHVNKVSSAVQLRLDVRRSSLPPAIKTRLLKSQGRRIDGRGILVIKAQRFRSQSLNRTDALERLHDLLKQASQTRKPRKPTGPSKAVRRRRVDEKTQRGRVKVLRRRVDGDS